MDNDEDEEDGRDGGGGWLGLEEDDGRGDVMEDVGLYLEGVDVDEDVYEDEARRYWLAMVDVVVARTDPRRM